MIDPAGIPWTIALIIGLLSTIYGLMLWTEHQEGLLRDERAAQFGCWLAGTGGAVLIFSAVGLLL
jgi:hypothetical protein